MRNQMGINAVTTFATISYFISNICLLRARASDRANDRFSSFKFPILSPYQCAVSCHTHSTQKYSQTSAITNDEKSTFAIFFVCRMKNSARAMRASGHEHWSTSKGTRWLHRSEAPHTIAPPTVWWSRVHCMGKWHRYLVRATKSRMQRTHAHTKCQMHRAISSFSDCCFGFPYADSARLLSCVNRIHRSKLLLRFDHYSEDSCVLCVDGYVWPCEQIFRWPDTDFAVDKFSRAHRTQPITMYCIFHTYSFDIFFSLILSISFAQLG